MPAQPPLPGGANPHRAKTNAVNRQKKPDLLLEAEALVAEPPTRDGMDHRVMSGGNADSARKHKKGRHHHRHTRVGGQPKASPPPGVLSPAPPQPPPTRRPVDTAPAPSQVMSSAMRSWSTGDIDSNVNQKIREYKSRGKQLHATKDCTINIQGLPSRLKKNTQLSVDALAVLLDHHSVGPVTVSLCRVPQPNASWAVVTCKSKSHAQKALTIVEVMDPMPSDNASRVRPVVTRYDGRSGAGRSRDAMRQIEALLKPLGVGAYNESQDWMILPHGTLRLRWDLLMAFLCIWVALVVPFKMAFQVEVCIGDWDQLDSLIDVLFIFDIVLNFRTGFYDNESLELVLDAGTVAKRYTKSWLAIDLLAAFPTGLLQASLDAGECSNGLARQPSSGQAEYSKILKLLRITRVLQLLRLRKLGHGAPIACLPACPPTSVHASRRACRVPACLPACRPA